MGSVIVIDIIAMLLFLWWKRRMRSHGPSERKMSTEHVSHEPEDLALLVSPWRPSFDGTSSTGRSQPSSIGLVQPTTYGVLDPAPPPGNPWSRHEQVRSSSLLVEGSAYSDGGSYVGDSGRTTPSHLVSLIVVKIASQRLTISNIRIRKWSP